MPRLSQDSWAVLLCFPPFKKHPSSSTQSPVTQASWQWSKLPKVFFFTLVFIYADYNAGMCWRVLDPVNTASGARKGRERGGGRGAGCFFPCRISCRAGKAGTLKNTVSLDLVSLQSFFHYLCILKTAETSFLGSTKRGSLVGGGNCLWCFIFGRCHRSSWGAVWALFSLAGFGNRSDLVTSCAKNQRCWWYSDNVCDF